MKKVYVVYVVVTLVLCVAGLLALNKAIARFNEKLAAIHAPEQVAPVRAPQPAVPAPRPVPAEDTAVVAARIQKALAPLAILSTPAPAPRPVGARFYAGASSGAGRIVTNADIRPARTLAPAGVDLSAPHVIVEFSPKAAGQLGWQDAVKAKRCAAYSFVDAAGKTVNRLDCAPLVR